jgi:hypothetical protein
MEEYSDRFQDGELPEACLTDVLRARMPLATGLQCVAVITRLLQPGGVLLVDESAVQAATVKAEEADKARARKGASLAAVTSLAAAPEAAPIVVDASKAIKITLMKLVNKYAERDPTHFRQHTCTLKLQWRGMSAYAEVEVHYVEIMKVGISNNSSAYEHYNFFREKLKGTVPEGELDELLEEKLIFLVDATGIPVLLSLLVLIFTSGGEDLTKLPSNRIELYEIGIDSAVSKRLLPGNRTSTDLLIHDWLRLFNLDRSALTQTVDVVGPAGGDAAEIKAMRVQMSTMLTMLESLVRSSRNTRLNERSSNSMPTPSRLPAPSPGVSDSSILGWMADSMSSGVDASTARRDLIMGRRSSVGSARAPSEYRQKQLEDTSA